MTQGAPRVALTNGYLRAIVVHKIAEGIDGTITIGTHVKFAPQFPFASALDIDSLVQRQTDKI